MNSSDRSFCLSAVAYLKAAHPADDMEASYPLELADLPVFTDFVGDLATAYLVDEGASFAYVQNRRHWTSGLSVKELHDQAVENLASLAGAKAEVRQFGEICTVTMGGNFEASLLLVKPFWAEWYRSLVEQRFIAAVPARDVLAFGDADSPQVQGRLLELAGRIGQLDHPLVPELLVWSNGVWSVQQSS